MWVGILGICVTSSILRVRLSGFWVSGSQFRNPRDSFPGSWVSGSQFHGPRSRVPESWVSGSQSLRLRVQGPGSQGPFCLLLLKKSDKICKRSPETPFCFNLKISPSCQTLSKALDISKKTPLTSNPSSNDL